MLRKRSSSFFEQVKHVCKYKGYLPLHKFQGLNLSEAINLVSHYLPENQTFFPFTESADFEFGVEGLSNIMQAFPKQVSTISFNVRYLLMMEEYALIALVKAVPQNITCVMLDYKDEYDEFPASDFSDYRELKNPDSGPSVQSLKMLVSTFSTCFGAPFFPRPPSVYAELLMKRLQQDNADVYLVNTGWTGGAHGEGGNRFSIPTTRAVIRAIVNGDLKKANYDKLPGFNLDIPTEVTGVDSKWLDPRKNWNNLDALRKHT